MADEISASVRMSGTKGNFKIPALGGTTYKVTLAGDTGGAPGPIEATTTATAFDFGPLSTLGMVYIKNTSAAGSGNLMIGKLVTGTLHDCIEVRPGEEHLTRFPSTYVSDLGYKSSTGTVSGIVYAAEA